MPTKLKPIEEVIANPAQPSRDKDRKSSGGKPEPERSPRPIAKKKR